MIPLLSALLVIVCCAVLARLAWRWWPDALNPIVLGILVWLPAFVMMNWPQFFISPKYIHQNRPFHFSVFLAMGMAFLAFWLGCALVRYLSRPDAFKRHGAGWRTPVSELRLLVLYGIGLAIFIYSYTNSGLSELSTLNEQQVAERRVALHIGPLSFVQIFMDIGAIGFYARCLQTRRWLYLLPLLIAIACYGLTLQKSLIVWMIVAALFVSAVYPRSFYEIFLRRAVTQLFLVVGALAAIILLAATNTARGITAATMTLASSPLLEQAYIYSGATAIKNLSVTLEGYLPSIGPTYGKFLIRPFLWAFTDRSQFESSRYFEGVNAATFLNVAWIDFRWWGFFITPLLTGMVVMLFIRMALTGRLVGLLFGAVAARAVVFTIGTDVIFEPVTWYTLFLIVVADALTYDRRRDAFKFARRSAGGKMADTRRIGLRPAAPVGGPRPSMASAKAPAGNFMPPARIEGHPRG